MKRREHSLAHPAGVVLAVVALAAVTLSAAVTLTGCQSPDLKAVYELRVTEAVVEADIPDDGPGTEKIAIRATWRADADGLVGSFSNPADTTAVIHWEDASISIDGGPPVPVLSAALYPNPDLPQPPTVIPRLGQIVIGILPGDAAEWEWLANRTMGGSWYPTAPLFGIAFTPEMDRNERLSLAETAVGKKIMIELPVRTGKRSLTYIYDIRVAGADLRPSSN